MKKYLFLDSLRGLAILAILLVHSSLYTENLSSLVGQIVYQGARGVQLFLILSALTIFMSIDRRIKTEENKLYQNFFIRRFFRIAPLYYFAIFLYIIIHGVADNYWRGGAINVTTLNIIAHLFFVNGWNPYWINSIMGVEWCVAIEMTFYLIVPFIYKKIKNLTQSIIFLLISLSVLVLVNNVMYQKNFIPQTGLRYDFIFMWFPSQLPIFALGLVLYFILFKDGNLKTEIENMENKKTVSYICIAISVYLCITFSSQGNEILKIGKYELLPVYFLYGLFFIVLIYGLAVYPAKILVNKFTSFIGKISFSIYLIHFLIIKLTLPLIKNFFKTNTFFMNNSSNTLRLLFGYIIVLALSIPISYLTYKFIEEPMGNVGKKIIQVKDNRITS